MKKTVYTEREIDEFICAFEQAYEKGPRSLVNRLRAKGVRMCKRMAGVPFDEPLSIKGEQPTGLLRRLIKVVYRGDKHRYPGDPR